MDFKGGKGVEDIEDKLFENNRQRVIKILKDNPEFCKSLGIENFNESKVKIKDSGCMDGAVYDGENEKVFFKLSSCAMEDGIAEYGDDILGDYIGLFILKKFFGCNVPDVSICNYNEEGGVNKYLFASKEVKSKENKMHTITNFLLGRYTKDDIGIDTLDFLKLLSGLYILGAQDLNRDNFMFDNNKTTSCLACFDADFRKFYRGFDVEKDDNFRHYNSIKTLLKDDILSKALDDQIKFDFTGGRAKINRLLAAVTYVNQLAEDFDELNKKNKLVFHPKLSKIITDDVKLNDTNLNDILESFKSVKFKGEDFLKNTYGLNEEGRNFIKKTLEQIKEFVKSKFNFLETGNEVVSPEPVNNSCSREAGNGGVTPNAVNNNNTITCSA
jgi:hypothetical protein